MSRGKSEADKAWKGLSQHNGALVALSQPVKLVLNGIHNVSELWEVYERLHRDGELGGLYVYVAELQEQPLIGHRAIPVGLQVNLHRQSFCQLKPFC